MKVLAFNSSPHKDKGNTALILNPFLKGMREAGAEVELFYTCDLDINPCRGELNCMLKTPGKCLQNDDIQMLTPKLGADVLVFASPVYIWAVNGQMKNLMDRMIPLLPPNKGRVILVSSCGFWGLENFDPLIFHMKTLCRNIDREFAGALLRPHAVYLKMMLEAGAPVQDIPAAAEEAGRQLVVDHTINPKTLGIISRELVSLETWNQRVKQRFSTRLSGHQISIWIDIDDNTVGKLIGYNPLLRLP